MKTNISRSNFKIIVLTVLILSLSISSLYAQNNSNNKNVGQKLIGSWTLDYNATINEIKSEARIYYDSLKQEKKDFIKASFSNRKIMFNEDGNYNLEIGPGKIKNGTWALLDDQVTLVLQVDGKQYEQRVEKISTSNMILNLGGDQSKGQLFQKWYLKKLTN